LLSKKEVATNVLSSVAEPKYPGIDFYWYVSNNLVVLVLPISAKARIIVKALQGHIIPLSEESLNAIDNIGQCHFPKNSNLLFWKNHYYI